MFSKGELIQKKYSRVRGYWLSETTKRVIYYKNILAYAVVVVERDKNAHIYTYLFILSKGNIFSPNQGSLCSLNRHHASAFSPLEKSPK